jgi:hypothetical protein
MAVRTNQAGIKHKRQVDPRSAYPAQGSTASRKKTLRAASADARSANAKRMKPGPAAKHPDYERGRMMSTVAGRKKPPSEMKLKRQGGA